MEKKIKIKTLVKKQLADLQTPVGLYLKLRDQFSNCILLESSDYHSKENSFSFIGVEPIATLLIERGHLKYNLPHTKSLLVTVDRKTDVAEILQSFCQQFHFEGAKAYQKYNGLFGHTNFDAVQYFESIELTEGKKQNQLPDLRYSVYRFIIVMNHFTNEMYFLENLLEGDRSRLSELEGYLKKSTLATFSFDRKGQKTSNLTDKQFEHLVQKGKEHCAKGDVFQLVLSRQFQQKFKGDEFNVYRALRSINPSPYLFYFDYGTYKLFGSSPEAQIVIQDKIATITPIAGTYRRTGDDLIDEERAKALRADPKENAEHVMLVDLARNDLNRHTQNVTVSEYKQIQFYSHVIHLVSKVQGKMNENGNVFRVFGDTFPAGTLSGAPKYKALELIDQYENQNRGFYGGAIGFFNPTGMLNQAIMIRSFMSHNNTLYSQAGAGIVIDSIPQKEREEVTNKLLALEKALELAEKL
jgi:anthranilate synthase component 1